MNDSQYTVVVTRPEAQAETFIRLLEENEFPVLQFPVIRIEPIISPEAVRLSETLSAGGFDWILFTSANAVWYFHALCMEEMGAELPANIQIGCVGRQTEIAVQSVFKRSVDVVPEVANSKALGAALGARGIEGSNVLIPGAVTMSLHLADLLAGYQAQLATLPVYETVPNKPDEETLAALERLDSEELLWTFFSPSAVKSAMSVMQESRYLLEPGGVVSIGPSTSERLREYGLDVSIEASEQSEAGMLRAIWDLIS